MAGSSIRLIAPVVEFASSVSPSSILDAGAGFGKYGYLLREYLDACRSRVYEGRYKREAWQLRIDASEIFEEYIHDGHRFSYDSIYGDMVPLIAGAKAGAWDLIVCIGTIEHFEKDAGHALLQDIDRVSEHSCITTPVVFQEQGAPMGNEHMRHLCVWSASELEGHGYKVRTVGTSLMATK